MRRQSLLILKYSVFLAMICVQGCALLMVRGIEFMKERNDIKERVDVSYSTEIKIEEVWYAALKASNNLGLSIVTKDFGGNNGLIVASTSSRNYIHIYISVDDSHMTNIGVQARKKKIPSEFSDYDFAFAEKIIHTIRKIIEPNFKPST